MTWRATVLPVVSSSGSKKEGFDEKHNWRSDLNLDLRLGSTTKQRDSKLLRSAVFA